MTPGGCPPPWRDPRVIGLILLVFLCGSAAGALSARYRYRQMMQNPKPPVAAWKEYGKEVTLQKFRKELNLSDDQAKEIELVLDDFMMYYQTLQAQMDEVRASGKERIVRVLDASQREKFGRMMSDLQNRQIR
jgi:hypothetical protein